MSRGLMLASVALLLAGGAGAAAAQRPSTLKDAYRDAFKVGVAVNEAIVAGTDTASRAIVLRQFNTITDENVLKAERVNPRPGEYTWGPADAYVAFGREHGLFVVGHTLVWHNQTPAWFFQDSTGKPWPREVVAERLRQHVTTVAGRYAGKVDAWDVVNEVVDNDGSYRQTSWVKGIGSGDELVRAAFRAAAQAAPGAELYYNDFNAWRPAKRDGIVRLVRMLKREGIRIDGVGMQGHWGLNYPKTEDIEAAIDSFAAAGVKVMITELDVDVLPLTKEGQVIGQVMSDPQFQLREFKAFLDPYPKGLPPAVERQLTERYAELFRIFWRKRDKLDRVTLWGLHDGMSWKNGYPVPGRTNYPLLWDREKRPKPALAAVLAVSMAAPATGQPAGADPWQPIRFLVGAWRGESEGQAGKGSVRRSYAFVLHDRYLEEKNVSTYPAQAANKRGEVHEHRSLFSYDGARKTLVLRQFHQEGFVNQYVLNAAASGPGKLVFDSESFENLDARWRARETYDIQSPDRFVETFEVAEPGKELELYSRNRFARVKRLP